MRKICAITANRADWSRIESILKALKTYPTCKLQLVVIGGHLSERTGWTIKEIERKGFSVSAVIHTHIEGNTPGIMTKSVGVTIQKLVDVIEKLKPDVIIASTDRFETLAVGVTAALMNVHIAHIQGGEVTGTIDESIRHTLTKLSHLHFVSTEKSRERVIKMGEPAEFVFNVGCPATDLLLKMPVWSGKKTLEKLNESLVGTHLLRTDAPYIIMVQHPVTTEFGSSGSQIKETLIALAEFDSQVVVLSPNIDAGGDDISSTISQFVSHSEDFYLFSHIPTEIFVNVLRNASLMVGNSSSGIREACYFGTPVVNVGTRQSGRERSMNVIDVGNDRTEISRAIKNRLAHGKYPVEQIYGDGTAGEKIAEILLSVSMPPVQKRITY